MRYIYAIIVTMLMIKICACNTNLSHQKNENVKRLNEINFEIGTSGILFDNLPNDTILFKNNGQLKTTFEDQYIGWVDNIPIWQRYSEEFFNDSALVLFMYGATGCPISWTTEKKLNKDKNKLTLNVLMDVTHYVEDLEPPFAISDKWNPIRILLEVSQNDVANVIEIKTIVVTNESFKKKEE